MVIGVGRGPTALSTPILRGSLEGNRCLKGAAPRAKWKRVRRGRCLCVRRNEPGEADR